jgi:perosamine synthetase
VFPVYRGRVALALLLRALGLRAPDEVIIQAFTCIAVPEALAAAGVTAVYVDVAPGAVTMDPADVARKITPRTRAIVVQHSFGIPTPMADIVSVASRHGIAIIEDCCHSHTSRIGGRELGTFGIGAFHSYEWGKPVPLGVGGTLTVNDRSLLPRIGEIHTAFVEPGAMRACKVRLQAVAYRSLLTPRRYWLARSLFRAASRWGLAEGSYNPVGEHDAAADFSMRMLPHVWKAHQRRAPVAIDRFRAQSARLAASYTRAFAGARVSSVVVPPETDVTYVRYPVLVDDKQRALALARRARVEVADWYATPVHPLPPAAWHQVGYSAGSCPEAERRAAHFVSFPLHAKVTESDVARAGELVHRL